MKWLKEEIDLIKEHMWEPITAKELRDLHFPAKSVGSVRTMRSTCRSGKDRLNRAGLKKHAGSQKRII